MLATDKIRVTVYLVPSTEEKLRLSVVHHRKNLSEITQAALEHCLDDPHFIEKLTKKEEIDR